MGIIIGAQLFILDESDKLCIKNPVSQIWATLIFSKGISSISSCRATARACLVILESAIFRLLSHHRHPVGTDRDRVYLSAAVGMTGKKSETHLSEQISLVV